MAKYEVVLAVMVRMFVEARNEDEARQFILEDTERQIGHGIDFVDGGGICDSIEIEVVNKESGEETFQCPNCDAWGYDVAKAFCKVCDVEEEEDVDEN